MKKAAAISPGMKPRTGTVARSKPVRGECCVGNPIGGVRPAHGFLKPCSGIFESVPRFDRIDGSGGCRCVRSAFLQHLFQQRGDLYCLALRDEIRFLPSGVSEKYIWRLSFSPVMRSTSRLFSMDLITFEAFDELSPSSSPISPMRDCRL